MSAGLIRKSRKWVSATTVMGPEASGWSILEGYGVINQEPTKARRNEIHQLFSHGLNNLTLAISHLGNQDRERF